MSKISDKFCTQCQFLEEYNERDHIKYRLTGKIPVKQPICNYRGSVMSVPYFVVTSPHYCSLFTPKMELPEWENETQE